MYININFYLVNLSQEKINKFTIITFKGNNNNDDDDDNISNFLQLRIC